MNDIEFICVEIDKIMKEAHKYADKDNETKKEFINRLKEKTIKYFELTNVPIATLASYIWGGLEKIEFSMSRSHFYDCFTDDEKGNYSDKFGTEHFIGNHEDSVKTNPVTGQIKYHNVTYSPDLPSEVKPKTMEVTDAPEPTKDKYTDLLNLIGDTASKLQVTVDAIEQRYDDNKEIIQEVLEPIQDAQYKYAHYYAIISNSKDVLDDRNKWGDYEKIMAKFLMDGGETIAHISKLMDYSSKFGSIGILNNADLQKKVEQLGQCPKCQANIYFEVNESLKEIEKLAELEL